MSPNMIFQQQQNVLNNGKKPPATRKGEKETKSESSHDGGESKENQEAQPDALAELPKDAESKVGPDAKSSSLKKRGGEGEQSFLSDLDQRHLFLMNKDDFGSFKSKFG